MYCIVSIFHGYLQGHILWMLPEMRGRGLASQYFDRALDVARTNGLKGFLFFSTLPLWEKRAPRYGFACRTTLSQEGGPDVLLWVREV